MTDRILEIGEAGLETTDQKVRKLVDNLINAQVPGYKKSEAVVRGFPLELEEATKKYTASKPLVEDSYYNQTQGTLVKTDNNLDLALAADGYFVLSGPWGEGYTRDGRFRLDNEGHLISVSGNYPVMGKGGPVVVPAGANVEFTQNGEIKVDGVVMDAIRVVKPEQNGALESLNGSIFKKKGALDNLVDVENPRVLQGYVESSNVNVIDQMMEMIYLERQYNLNAKYIINAREQTLSKAMDLGRATQ